MGGLEEGVRMHDGRPGERHGVRMHGERHDAGGECAFGGSWVCGLIFCGDVMCDG